MKNYRRHERGSAVILALALLSLMLILIMSFVTNALLDSRIADTKKQLHNVQNIGDIALNRALMSLNFSVAGDGDVGKFDNFVSWAYNGDLPHAASSHNPPTNNAIGNDGYNKYREADSGDSDYEALRMAYDGIKKVMDTKLYNNNDDIYLYRYPTHRDSDDDKITNSSNYWFKGAFSQQPRWIYLYEDPNNTNSPKIGRFAYAVLPDKGQININSLVGGPLNVIDEDRTGDNTNEFQADQIVVNEYANEDEQKKISNTSGSNIFAKVEKDGTNIYAQRGNDISNFINFNISDKRIINALYQKFVFNQNLYPSDGAYPSDGETFYVKGDPNVKSRFNLTDPNSYNGKSVDDIITALPFLRNIGSSKGNFYSFEDYRKQIAANLLDLGDSDDIPTSDVPAALWAVDNAPPYTGNEKTPYLSAMAVNTTVELNNNLTNRSLNFNFYPQFELVDLYDVGGNNYNLDFKFTNFSAEFDLAGNTRIKAYAKIKVKARVKIKIGRLEFDREVTIPTPITQQFEFSIEDLQDFAATKGSSVTLPRVKVENIFSTKTTLDNTSLSGWGKTNDDDFYQTNQLFDKANPITVTINDYTTFLSTFISDNYSIIKAYAKEKAITPGTQIKFEGAITGITLASDMMTVTEVTDVTDLPATSGLQGREILSLDEVTNPKGTFDSCVFVLKKGTTGIDYAKIDTPKNDGDTSGNLYNVNGVKLFSLMCDDPRVNLNASDWEFKCEMNSFDPDATPSVLKTFDNAKFQHIADIDLANKFNDPSIFTYSTLAGVSRGKAWETINILDAAGDLNRGAFEDFVWKAGVRSTDTGTTYADGDGGILNQIKLNDEAPFKINIATTSKDIWRGLLYGLKYDSDGDGDVDDVDDDIFSDSDLEIFIENIVNEIETNPSNLKCRSDLVELIETANTGLSSDLTDPQKYGIIDGIMHLIKVEQYPEEFQILIVAQSINPNSLADDISKAVTATEKVLVTVRRIGDEFNIIKKEKMPF